MAYIASTKRIDIYCIDPAVIQMTLQVSVTTIYSAAVRATRVRFQDSLQGDNPGQQPYHARAEQLGELGLPGCDEALSGMGGASLTNDVPGVM